jgi:IMP dehydrogenase/GMP reductase
MEGFVSAGILRKALAAGASSVMIGGLLAGVDRKSGWGYGFCTGTKLQAVPRYGVAGSRWSTAAASATGRDRLQRVTRAKLVPEGVEGRVPYKGALQPLMFQLTGGLRSGMGYVGAATVKLARSSIYQRSQRHRLGRTIHMTSQSLRKLQTTLSMLRKTEPVHQVLCRMSGAALVPTARQPGPPTNL